MCFHARFTKGCYRMYRNGVGDEEHETVKDVGLGHSKLVEHLSDHQE